MHRGARSKFLILLPMPFARPVMWSVRHPSHRWFHQQGEGVIYLCHTSTCKHGQGRYETAGERAGCIGICNTVRAPENQEVGTWAIGLLTNGVSLISNIKVR